MARLLRFAAVAVLVGGATAFLSGCTGDSDPVVSLSPSVTAEATPSPSPSVSVSPTPTALSDEELLELIPEDARVESFIGASNFAKFFLLEYNRMFSTGDSRLFQALSEPGCTFCANSLREFEDVIGSGGSVVGGGMTIEEGLAAGGDLGDGTTNASFGIEIGEVQYLDSEGVVVDTVPPTAGRLGVLMRYRDGHWSVIDVGSDQT